MSLIPGWGRSCLPCRMSQPKTNQPTPVVLRAALVVRGLRFGLLTQEVRFVPWVRRSHMPHGQKENHPHNPSPAVVLNQTGFPPSPGDI